MFVGNDITVAGSLNIAGIIANTDDANIGTATNPINEIYANNIHADSYGVHYGSVQGNATSAN